MTENIHRQRANPRREKTTRRAFILWMAAYAAALVVVVMLHSFGGGTAPDIAIDANGMQTQQARVTGEPQSSLADRPVLDTVAMRVDG